MNASGSDQPVENTLPVSLTTTLFAITQWGYVNREIGYIFNTELTPAKIRVRSIAVISNGSPGVTWIAFGK